MVVATGRCFLYGKLGCRNGAGLEVQHVCVSCAWCAVVCVWAVVCLCRVRARARQNCLHFSRFIVPNDDNICRTNSPKTCKTHFRKLVLRKLVSRTCSAPPRHPTLGMRSTHPACQTCQTIRSITVQSLKGQQGSEQRGKVGKLTTTVLFPFKCCR
jgi:hypothetical protein